MERWPLLTTHIWCLVETATGRVEANPACWIGGNRQSGHRADLVRDQHANSPVRPAPINAALWPGEKDGEYTLVWNRPKRDA